MRSFALLTALFAFLNHSSHCQTGPGGVGTSSNNVLWLDASFMTGIADNTPINSWPDRSGNALTANQLTGTSMPRYQNTIINGRPGLHFDGTNDFLRLSSHLSTPTITYFFVGHLDNTNGNRAIFVNREHHVFSRTTNGRWGAWYNGTFVPTLTALNSGQNTMLRMATSGASTSVSFETNGGSPYVPTRGALANKLETTIGSNNPAPSSFGYYHKGGIGEVIVFNVLLNVAQELIVENYLSSKYSIAVPTDLYAFDPSHSGDVAGIGQASNGTNHTNSRGSGIIQIQSPSNLSNSEFLLWGHNETDINLINFTNHPYGLPNAARLDRVWRADQTGNVGTVTLSVDLSTNNFGDPAEYELLIDMDGDFSSGVTQHTTGYSYNAGTQTATWTGVDLPDGAFFTIGNRSSKIRSITTGNWENTTTWNCSCIPFPESDVTISATDVVSLFTGQQVSVLTIEATGQLDVTTPGLLTVAGNITSDGLLNAQSGGLEMTGTVPTVLGGTGNITTGTINFNNGNGVSLDGNILLDVYGTLNLQAGNLTIGSNQVTLISNDSQTARIGQVTGGNFFGSMIIQRHISTRVAGFSTMASPVTSTTIQDWDDEILIVYASGGSSYPSVLGYDESQWDWEYISSSNEPLTPGKGFEVWLDDDGTYASFSETIIDSRGTPNRGNISRAVTVDNDGWNLIGNPYAAHIDWTTFRSTSGIFMYDHFMYWDEAEDDYSFGGPGDEIAPHQGFWIEASSAGNVIFRETNKTTSNSSFFRSTQNGFFRLKLKHEGNISFTSNTNFLFEDGLSKAYEQGSDVTFKKVPHPNAPSLYSLSTEGKRLRLNKMEAENNLDLRLGFAVGVSGFYTISANELGLAQDAGFTCIVLEDKVSKTFTDLSEGSYRFYAEGASDERFVLHLSKDNSACTRSLSTTSNTELQGITITHTEQGIFVNYNLEDEMNSVISVTNLLGQEIVSARSISISKGNIRVALPESFHGMFIVSVRQGEKMVTRKFFAP